MNLLFGGNGNQKISQNGINTTTEDSNPKDGKFSFSSIIKSIAALNNIDEDEKNSQEQQPDEIIKKN